MSSRDTTSAGTGGKRAAPPRRRRGAKEVERRRHKHPRAEHRLPRLRWLLFGDWHPVLRDPLDLLRLSFGVAAVVFHFQGDTAV